MQEKRFDMVNNITRMDTGINSPKPARNFAGGIKRFIRITIGIIVLSKCVDVFRSPSENNLGPYFLAIWGAVCLLSLYLLKGTIKRLSGLLLALVMLIFVVIGHALTLLGISDTLRRMSLSVLLAGLTVVFTGHASWSIIAFAARKCRAAA
jgi:hypothetical protein